jgi:hypothetical protein
LRNGRSDSAVRYIIPHFLRFVKGETYIFSNFSCLFTAKRKKIPLDSKKSPLSRAFCPKETENRTKSRPIPQKCVDKPPLLCYTERKEALCI